MGPEHLQNSRLPNESLTKSSHTQVSYRESSSYFSQEAPRANSLPTNQTRVASVTMAPAPSSPRGPVDSTTCTSSYGYYGDPSESTNRSRISRPSTSFTSRTSRTPFLPCGENHTIVCALSEARGITPAVGVAFFNVDTGEAILSQISDNRFFVRTLHKLQLLRPSHLLIVSSCCPPNPKSRLYSHIEEHVPDAKIIPFDRKHWSEMDGLEYIETFAFREDAEAVKVAIEGSFYATCSFSAVFDLLHINMIAR